MIRFLCFLISLFLLTAPSAAQALLPQQVPDPLKPWVNWVLEDDTQFQCPFVYQDFQQKRCSWPGALKLALNNNGGRFNGEWTLYRADWVILPGDQQNWPQQVVVDHQPAVVIEHNGKPSIWLAAGHFQIDGNYHWDSLPDNLAISDDTGLIELNINNASIAYPRIEQGAIWLTQQQDASDPIQQNSLDLQVFRQVIDSIPLQIITRLELNVSGAAREITLPHALLPQFIPISLESPLPARLEADGQLSLQVRPGHWSLTLQARHPQQLDKLEFSAVGSVWPQNELWAFQAMPELRLVEIDSLQAIDGSQTNLPEEWRHLPTYQIQSGQSMIFKTLRRGDPEPEPNQLNLTRKLWLDFDGGGYTVSDSINGKMSRDGRLNAISETQLGQVLLNGQNQLITQQSDSAQGIEVRHGTINMQADSRIQSTIGSLNAVGWQQSFQQVRAELNIPPGWRLLAISGVDNDPNCWLTQWTLLDLFLVLIIALAVARLSSWTWGAIALLSLVLIWHEADAPRWIWLNTLAALALLRVLPANRFSLWLKWYRNLSWLALIAIVIPFMVEQIRIGLYPQLERPWQTIEARMDDFSSVSSANTSLVEPMAMDMEMEMAKPAAAPAPSGRMFKKSSAVSKDEDSKVNLDRIDPNANLQTGPGLMQWQWQRVELSWNGAVDQQQQIRLWYLSPPFSLLLHVAQALLAALLTLQMLGVINLNGRLSLPKLSLLIILPLLLTPAADSYADIPDQPLLEQLKSRLLQNPDCLPSCAQLANMSITAEPETLKIELELHAQQAVYLPLPAQLKQWYPSQVNVDGHPASGLIREDDDSLWLMLPAGVHKVLMQGQYASHQTFTLPLPINPLFTRVKTEGWQIDGIYENGKTNGQLEFSRIDLKAENLAQPALPAFVQVERTLQLGLDWRVTTRISNMGGESSAVMLELPLLPGEAVTTPEIRIKNGKALVNMAAGQSELEWQSTLEKREQLELGAPDTTQWNEIWRADVSPTWHLQSSGLAVIQHHDQNGSWLPEWRPWPGENLLLTISRPTAVAGATLTIDKSLLGIQPGKRSEMVTLNLDLRSSKGGQHPIVLPSGAVLQNAMIDGSSQPIRQQGSSVTLPIHPGLQHISLSWQTTNAQSSIFNTPKVNLGLHSVNSHIQATIGDDRWVLFTLGPKFGPAALIWGLLVVLALLALGLNRLSITPLRHWQWFLLLIGLSQIEIGAGFIVVGWLFALGLRARHTPERDSWFNLAQVGLALLSLCSILLLFAAVHQGLLGSPDMQISGNQSTANSLNWYQDHSGPLLPTAMVISVPLMLYRILMLGWALWMALSLLNWLRWGWDCFSSNGIWRHAQPTLPKSSQ
jgi:hypothetical protein